MNKRFFLDQCQWCNLVVRNHPPEPFKPPRSLIRKNFNIGLYGKMNKRFFLDQCQWCNLVVRNHPPEPFSHPGL